MSSLQIPGNGINFEILYERHLKSLEKGMDILLRLRGERFTSWVALGSRLHYQETRLLNCGNYKISVFTPLELNSNKVVVVNSQSESNAQENSKRSPDDDEDTTGPSRKQRKRRQPLNTSATRRSTRTKGQQLAEKVWCPDFKQWVTPHWTFSPDSTAEDAIRRFRVSGWISTIIQPGDDSNNGCR